MNAKTVYGYVRVSSKGQVEGDGPDRQKIAIEYFCKQHGLIWSGHFSEEGISGTVEAADRPEFSSMLDYIKEHHVDGIVVERMDRLARDLMVSEILLRTCRELGIKVFCVDQGDLTDMASDGGDPTRVLIRQIMGALAQWEKSNLVKKLKSSRERARAKNGWCEGRKPYGDKPGEKIVLTVIAGLLDGVAKPDYSSAARLLNEGGFKTRAASEWTRQTVRSIWLNYKTEKGKKI